MILVRMCGSAVSLAVGFAVLACRYEPSTVALEGARADIASLAGAWAGEYWSTESGRDGSIYFRVAAGTDTALGDVVMTPKLGQPLEAADRNTAAHRAHARGPAVLRVQIVRIDAGVIRGEMEPYIAPDCECVVTTVFRGALIGDRIEGTYVTRNEGGLQQGGRWFVIRRSPK